MSHRITKKCTMGNHSSPEKDGVSRFRSKRLFPLLDADDHFSSLPILTFTAYEPFLFPDTGKQDFKIIVVAHSTEETLSLLQSAFRCLSRFPVRPNEHFLRSLDYRFGIGISGTVPAHKGEHSPAGLQE